MKITELERNDIKTNQAWMAGSVPKRDPEPWKIQGLDVYFSPGKYVTKISLFNKSKLVGSFTITKQRDDVHFWPVPGWDVMNAMIHKSQQGKGLALDVYTYLVTKLGWALYSTGSHSPGAEKLWARLSKTPGISVYVLDQNKVEIPKITPTGIMLPDKDIYALPSMSVVAVATNGTHDNKLKSLINSTE